MTPTADRVLIEPIEVGDLSTIIATPDAYRPSSETSGIVRALGPKCKGDVLVGQVVYFSPMSGTEMNIDGERLFMMTEKEILAVEDEE